MRTLRERVLPSPSPARLIPAYRAPVLEEDDRSPTVRAALFLENWSEIDHIRRYADVPIFRDPYRQLKG